MGCDIHLYVEKKVGTKWVCLNPMTYCPFADKLYEERTLDKIFRDRNYELFGWLAQVRCEQENSFEAKGFPFDSSQEVKKEYLDWDKDAHSASYLTLRELKENMIGTINVSGQMDANQWIRLQKEAKEGNYDSLYPHCAWSSMSEYVNFSIDIPIEHQFKRFKDICMAFMEKYTWERESRKHDAESVRIVFWFDN